MKILMLLAKPYPSDARLYPEAQSLLKRGHEVTLLSWDKKLDSPKQEILDGINVIRSYNSKFMEFLPYNIIKMHWWWKKGYKDALDLFKNISFDVVHCHDLNTLPLGVKLKRKKGMKLVYDAHEIWGYMVSNDLPKIWAEYYLFKEKKILKNVDHIITVNELLQEYFIRLSNKPTSIVMNAKPLLYKKYESPKNKFFTIKFIGTINTSRNLLKLIDIVKDYKDIELVIAGKGHDINYIEMVKKRCENSKNCRFIGHIPMQRVIPETRKADVVYCLTSAYSRDIKWPINIDFPQRFGLANKVFESMVAGRPIIVGKNTYNEKFTKKLGSGIAAENSKEDIRRVILELKNNPSLCKEMGERGFKAAKKEYNWKKQEEKLLEIYENLYK